MRGVLLLLLLPRDCSQPDPPPAAAPKPVVGRPAPAPAAAPDPIRIEPLSPSDAPPIFVMRGAPHEKSPLVFLHGMCGHALGYAQSFQFSAAKKGILIAPQADLTCGGPWSKWSPDLAALDARIEAAFRALGLEAPLSDVLVIGYSQGATRAEALARKYPDRYTRLILMGAPQAASAQGLGKLRGAVMMAGERDRKDQMRAGMRAFQAAGIPATFQIIPEATHGAMGPTPEKTMGEALDWLWANQKVF